MTTEHIRKKLTSRRSQNDINYFINAKNSTFANNSRKRTQSAARRVSFQSNSVLKTSENPQESIELIAMTQFRTGLMKEYLDIEEYNEKQQRNRMKKELLSRSHWNNAIYMLKAMPSRSRKSVVKGLFISIPGGTRFLRSKPGKS